MGPKAKLSFFGKQNRNNNRAKSQFAVGNSNSNDLEDVVEPPKNVGDSDEQNLDG